MGDNITMYEYARTDMPISFPGLFGDWSINPSPVAIPIGKGVRGRSTALPRTISMT